MKKIKPPEKIEMDVVTIETVRDINGDGYILITHLATGSKERVALNQLENWALRQLRAAIK